MKKSFSKTGIIEKTDGFTMVELIISVAVFAILAAVITPIYKQGTGYWQATKSQTELRQNLNLAMEIIAREIRQAEIVILPTNKLPATVIGQEIVTCYPNGLTSSFKLAGSPQFIALNSEAITSTTVINITSAWVREIPANEVKSAGTRGYEITISGEYIGNAAVNEVDKQLTVQTRVFSRPVNGIESWKELN